MNLADILRTATRPIRSRTLESALIVMAVALGVGVVTAMLALILNGLEQEKSFTSSIEARELVLVSRNDNYQGSGFGSNANPALKLGKASDKPVKLEQADLQTILKACPSLQYAYLNESSIILEPTNLEDPSRAKDIQVMAVTRSYIDAAKLTLLAGTWPSSIEFQNRKSVAAVTEWFARQRFGQTLKATDDKKDSKADASKSVPSKAPEKPFRLQDVIGKYITGQQRTYQIVAVFAPPKEGFVYANDQQNRFGARGIVPWGIQDFVQLEVQQLKFVARADWR